MYSAEYLYSSEYAIEMAYIDMYAVLPEVAIKQHIINSNKVEKALNCEHAIKYILNSSNELHSCVASSIS